MNIGSVFIGGRAFLAPMAGVSDLPFRALCAAQGAALAYTEMVSAKGLLYSPEHSAELLTNQGGPRPSAAQLFGSEPELMADMALQHCGEHDIVDINMGCPVPKVVKNGQGSALMTQPELAERIVRVMSERLPQPVTVKFRKGWDASNVNAVEFAQRMEQSGAAAVAVHGRTRDQFYAGKADWDIIAAVKRKVSIPVIGSGDVFSGADAMSMLRHTGCDAVMVARGAQGNPWIFAEITALADSRSFMPPTLAEVAQTALTHAQALLAQKGERIAVQEMRKHLSWYIHGIPKAAQSRGALNAVDSIEGIAHLLNRIVNGADLPIG